MKPFPYDVGSIYAKTLRSVKRYMMLTRNEILALREENAKLKNELENFHKLRTMNRAVATHIPAKKK